MTAAVDYKAVWLEVKENHRRLDGCKAHDFGSFVEDPGLPLDRQKLNCRNCGGAMSLLDIRLYAEGYRAAGGDPADVVRGFFD